MTFPGSAMGASLIFPVVICGFFSLGLTALADSSATWIGLVICGTASLAAVSWARDLQFSLMSIFLFTLPIDISKALTSVASAYGPVLQFYLSDLAFFPLATLWLFNKTVIHNSQIYWSGVHWFALLLVLWFSVSAIWGLEPTGYLLNFEQHKIFFVLCRDSGPCARTTVS